MIFVRLLKLISEEKMENFRAFIGELSFSRETPASVIPVPVFARTNSRGKPVISKA
jgi:hypothetical protein